MTTAYTSLLGLALPVQGELSGTWGDTVNNSITSLLDTSVAGTTNVSTDTDVTLTTTTGAANTARQAILLFSGARTALRTVTAPAQSKIYTVINATTGGFSVKLVGSGPTTGLTIPNGASAVVAWNGSDFVEVGSGSIGNLTVNGNLTVTGTSTLTGAITNTAGTANGVAYLNGSKVVTSGSALTFDGTNVLTLFRTTGTEANEPTIKFSNLVFAGQNAGVIKSSNGGLALDIQSPSDSTYQLRSRIYMNGGSGDNISFQASSNNGSTYGERMVLTSTGLGIGTSSPASKLHVSVDSANQFRLERPSIRTYSQVIYGDGRFSVVDVTAGAERIILDPSGNLGLGVIPSAWSGNYKALQSGNGSAFVGFNGNNQTFVVSNAYNDGSWKYKETSGAGYYAIQGVSNGTHIWYNAPSGTAGNAITFTQAMTLDASGNLLLGTTTTRSRITALGTTATTPTLGTATGTALFCPNDNAYGTMFGSANTGDGWIQQQRVDGTATAYNLILQPSGGNLLVGTTTAVGKVTIQDGALAFSGNASAPASNVGIYRGGSADNLIFATGGSERARITSGGALVVGATSPQIATSIYASGNSATDGVIGARNGTGNSTFQVVMDSNNNCGYLGTSSASGTALIRLNGEYGIQFTSGGSERARIDSSGRMLVGATSFTSYGTFNSYTNSTVPSGRFVGGPSTPDGNIVLMVDKYSSTNTTSQWFLGFTIGNTGTASGVITANGASQATFTSWSDRRLKENIVDLAPQLANIMALRPVEFDYIESEGGGHQISFIAQEFEEIYPDAIGARPDGMKTLSGWAKTEAILVKAIQEQQAIIESLKARLDAANL